ncbi:MAG: aminomethyl-transferring glycine dehydrogenase subunit GcvPA [Planctomycetia bacterium]|nr:aminomethyl-transferring glycine dehydrogenase subunit GcvPA [Planctomycetia bacterium]
MRYTPNPDPVVKEMLQTLGLSSLDDLFADIPENIRKKCTLPEGAGLSEMSLRRQLEQLALDNVCTEDCPIFLGAGCYDHYIPAAVSHLLARSEFYTAYTPYQPEISQGILQSIFEYQTLMCRLTGMAVANASLYCGGSALAQACQIAAEVTGKKRVLLPTSLHPDYARIVETYAISGKMAVEYIPCPGGVVDPVALDSLLNDQTAAVVIQYPNFYGNLEEVDRLVALARSVNAMVIMSVDPIALALLKSPGEWGADIAVGDGQPLGNPMNFGGPHLGFMAVTEKLMRKIPGRLVGETVDSRGQRSFVLTLQAREQHIRREKANSNICSNEALCALAACMYLAFVGPLGLKQAALNSHRLAWYAREEFTKAGFHFPYHAPFFREFVVSIRDPHAMNEYLLENGIIGGYELDGGLLLAFTERRTREEVDELVLRMKEFVNCQSTEVKEVTA